VCLSLKRKKGEKMLKVSFRKNGQRKPYVIANFLDWNDAWDTCQKASDFCFEAFEETQDSSVEAQVRAQYRRHEEKYAETVTVEEVEEEEGAENE
jgi:hypothetical protein